MAGISKVEREKRAKEQKVADSRMLVTAEAALKADDNWSYMDLIHQMAFDEDADRLHRMFNYVTEWLERDMAAYREKLAKFREDLAKVEEHPGQAAYVFEWADGSMEAAATLEATAEFLAWFRAKGPWKAFEHATAKALGLARYPSRSTSECHNQVAHYRVAAWAKLVENRYWQFGF